ncbi:hypothetical protein AB0A60_33455 [Streptomyces sp. NPDC046275]|uniref:hypothetical protein n=1 Tax=Streptomyces sp. NPDC046275 TaxID=3157201 RepID=UPI0034016BCF
MPAPLREPAVTVAVIADPDDFTAMRQFASFPHTDHTRYLADIDDLLHSLAADGSHVTVALFDPYDYSAFCDNTRINPDTHTSRTAYTADLAATGPRITYTGQPLPDLLEALADAVVQHVTHAIATALLADLGHCSHCGRDLGAAALEHASTTMRTLLNQAGPGTHHLVCSVPFADENLLAGLTITIGDVIEDTFLCDTESTEFLTVLAAGIARGGHGGLVLHTTTPDARGRARLAPVPRPPPTPDRGRGLRRLQHRLPDRRTHRPRTRHRLPRRLPPHHRPPPHPRLTGSHPTSAPAPLVPGPPAPTVPLPP